MKGKSVSIKCSLNEIFFSILLYISKQKRYYCVEILLIQERTMTPCDPTLESTLVCKLRKKNVRRYVRNIQQIYCIQQSKIRFCGLWHAVDNEKVHIGYLSSPIKHLSEGQYKMYKLIEHLFSCYISIFRKIVILKFLFNK